MSHPPPLRWSLPGGITLAFSEAVHGDLRMAPARDRWLASLGVAACVVPKQVHGAVVVDVDAPEAAAALDSADGLVGSGRLALGVFGADCPGLCIAAPDALGVAHCGWRGTAAGMAAVLVAAVARRSAHPRERWHAFIGPGIDGDAYEVDAPVLSSRRWPPAALRPRAQGRALLDLAEAIACDLREAGIASVTRSGVSTFRDSRLHSYRGGGAKLAQLLLAWRA